MSKRHIQYTIRRIPPELDTVVRDRARETGKSINTILVDAIKAALGVRSTPAENREFDDLIGSWVDDPGFDRAIDDQRKIDPELWR